MSEMLRFLPLKSCNRVARLLVVGIIFFFLVSLFIIDILEGRTRSSKQGEPQILNDIIQRLEKLERKFVYIKKSSKLLESSNYQVDLSVNQKNCNIPVNWRYPFCNDKIMWIRSMWQGNVECYIKQNQVDPTNDCSIIRFLSEEESWCPLLPGREKPNPLESRARAKLRTDKTQLLHMLEASNWAWIRDRINRFWPSWVEGILALEKRKTNFQNRASQNVLVFMGSFAFEPKFFSAAYYGGPLGELVQWTDLVSSLYILGHNLTISANKDDLPRLLNVPKVPGCASKARDNELDVIYTDYNGCRYIAMAVGPNHSQYRCRIQVVDSFGTEAEFNFAEYSQPIPGGRSPWANADLNLRQIMTMFPHSPDNTFLGFVVDAPIMPGDEVPVKKNIGLVYGKEARFWKGKRSYLDILHKYFELHATVTGGEEIPEYVVNHGILKGEEYGKLLDKAKVFIGLGFPYEGPAPLEAIAHGCIFLNAKLDPPHNRLNTDFFKTKPTFRALSSQHPYTEEFIGEPHVFTVDISNSSLVEQAAKRILKAKVKPYLPLEWTPEGMLERVNSYLQNIDYCGKDSKIWPPEDQRHLVKGLQGMSCKDTCRKNGLVCESFYFHIINTKSSFEKFNITCKKFTNQALLDAPSFSAKDGSCTLQQHPLAFSCVASKPDKVRLCPCRDFQPQQISLCKACD